MRRQVAGLVSGVGGLIGQIWLRGPTTIFTEAKYSSRFDRRLVRCVIFACRECP